MNTIASIPTTVDGVQLNTLPPRFTVDDWSAPSFEVDGDRLILDFPTAGDTVIEFGRHQGIWEVTGEHGESFTVTVANSDDDAVLIQFRSVHYPDRDLWIGAGGKIETTGSPLVPMPAVLDSFIATP